MSDVPHSSIPPQLPPTTEEDICLWLRLLRSRRVGPTTFFRLLKEHRSVSAAFAALPEIAAKAGVKDYSPCSEDTAAAEREAARRFGAAPLFWGASNYPKALYDLPDAPPMLWAFGDLALLSSPAIALVGARNASSLGTRMARSLASELGEAGHVIVSGLARGIDAVAHKAAIETGTIAVFAGGVDVIYPVENADLARQIGQKGLILSEQPMGLQPRSRHFPARNRIISGLSRAIVVVEAAVKSGSLLTARNALDQGREVLAVPGHPIETRASGCNLLIRDGATLVRSGQDVFDALAPLAPPTPSLRQPELNLKSPEPVAEKRNLQETSALHRQIMDRIQQTPMGEDHLIRDMHASSHQTSSALVDLELSGQITRTVAGLWMRKET